jgi:hypothetical protein
MRIDPAATEPAEIVPVWIVPLWRIPDVLPATPDAFDVVIVDGEHSAGAEALFLLWSAPRVVLVGHAGPALPAPGTDVAGPVLPEGLAQIVTPTVTLFDSLLSRFAEAPPKEPPRTQPQPEPEPEPETVEAPSSSGIRQGRSIVTYKRPELVALVRQVAEREPDLTDDQLVEVVSRLLACPEDEALLVGARVRYAVDAYRGTP